MLYSNGSACMLIALKWYAQHVVFKWKHSYADCIEMISTTCCIQMEALLCWLHWNDKYNMLYSNGSTLMLIALKWYVRHVVFEWKLLNADCIEMIAMGTWVEIGWTGNVRQEKMLNYLLNIVEIWNWIINKKVELRVVFLRIDNMKLAWMLLRKINLW